MSDTLLLNGSNGPLINGNTNIDYTSTNNQDNVTSNKNAIEQTYDSLFPALPETNTFDKINNVSTWTNNNFLNAKTSDTNAPNGYAPKILKVRSSKVTETFTIYCEEKNEIHRICADIAEKTNTEIEMTNNASGSTFLVAGKYEDVQAAKKRIAQELTTPISYDLDVPKECYKFILGKSGAKLKDLESKTGAKIIIPKSDLSEPIKIKGSKEAIDAAVTEIQSICHDALSKCKDIVYIERDFHAFINGPYNETVNELQRKTKAKIAVPPPFANKNEIYLMGDQNAINEAKEEILKIYNEKKLNCEAISVVIKKSQHKYIYGQKGSVLNEIFKTTGVAVEMPTDPESEQITLRGEQGKLGQALTFLYEKAHSEIELNLEVKDWIQRHLVGLKKSNLQELQANFPNVHFSFYYNDNLIKVNGSKKEVEKAKEVLLHKINLITSQFKIKELEINPIYHRYIIGKGGVNIKKIREETGAKVCIPDENDVNQNIVTIEGDDEAILKASQELDLIIKKAIEKESEIIKELNIEQRFHSQLIGTKGENIKEIRERFNVNIAFPDSSIRSDKVSIRGEKNSVENCIEYLTSLHEQLLNDNYRLELAINKKLLVHVIGTNSLNIRKIAYENDVRIDLPDEKSTTTSSNVIIIYGKKENVLKAKDQIQKIEQEELNQVQVNIIIPNKFHSSIIGKNNRFIRSISEECDNVNIIFPPEGTNSDKVTIRGSKEGVNKAKKILVELSNDKQLNNYEENVICKHEFHKYLIGKNGSNINKIKEPYKVRIIFPNEDEKDLKDTVTIIGKKENVLKAKKDLEQMINDLEKIVEINLQIPQKYHIKFISNKAALCRKISEDNHGVTIQFPFKNVTENSDKVILKGNKEGVESAKKQILEIIENLKQQIIHEIEIDPKYHGNVMGLRAINVKNIEQKYDVKIFFPRRTTTPTTGIQDNLNNRENQDKYNLEKRSNIIRVIGKKQDCEKAGQDLIDLVPITVELDVPFEYHRNIIGKGGTFLRNLQERYRINVKIPKVEYQSNKVNLIGLKNDVDEVEKIILDLVKEVDQLKLDEEARSYTVRIDVHKDCIPKVIGKKGTIINELRKTHQVKINFEDFGSRNNTNNVINNKNKINESSESESVDHEIASETSEHNGNANGNISTNNTNSNANTNDTIIIKGYEKNVKSAAKRIRKIIKEFESLVRVELEIDPENYSQLIGIKGRTIKRLMNDHKVEIKIPKDGSKCVTIIGNEKNVEACKNEILETITDNFDYFEAYRPPREPLFNEIEIKPAKNSNLTSEATTGFFVRDAPWEKQQQQQSNLNSHEQHQKQQNQTTLSNNNNYSPNQKPDTNNVDEFPSMNNSSNGSDNSSNNIAWGPKAN